MRCPYCGEDVAEELSPRQTEVLNLLSLGLTYKEIASELGIAHGTATLHVVATLRKLQAKSSPHAVRIGIEKGIITI